MTIVEIANKTNGRPIKFTPERIEQIKNLVERGKSREDIAEIINVTVGSLQVTCSRLGISLRRPKPRPQLAPFVPRSPSVEPAMPAMADKPCFELVIQYKGKERVTDLPLTDDAVRQLALEAAFHGISVAELMGRLITTILAARDEFGATGGGWQRRDSRPASWEPSPSPVRCR
jgi:helix-turn-helix resolvase-like protein